jgi:hypothetical protein
MPAQVCTIHHCIVTTFLTFALDSFYGLIFDFKLSDVQPRRLRLFSGLKLRGGFFRGVLKQRENSGTFIAMASSLVI